MSQGSIPESQFGFLPGKSVSMGLACAQIEWIEAKSHGDTVGVLGFDLSGAFDTVETSTLLSKLESTGISGIPLKWLKSYMTGRSQKVLWNDLMSSSRPLTHGVSQGSILGPTLFLVMVADKSRFVTNNMPNTKMTSYADESAFYVPAKYMNQLKQDFKMISSRMKKPSSYEITQQTKIP